MARFRLKDHESSTSPTLSVTNPINKDETFTMVDNESNHQLYTKLSDILYNDKATKPKGIFENFHNQYIGKSKSLDKKNNLRLTSSDYMNFSKTQKMNLK